MKSLTNYNVINDMRNYGENFAGLIAKKVIENVQKQIKMIGR